VDSTQPEPDVPDVPFELAHVGDEPEDGVVGPPEFVTPRTLGLTT
jgi:hypothetical protein